MLRSGVDLLSDLRRDPAIAAGSLVFVPIVLMLLVEKKYPRWWYDWNLELLRFGNRSDRRAAVG